MGFFAFFKRPDINSGFKQYKLTENAILLDVRTDEEFQGGHLPESVHLELNRLYQAEKLFPNKKTPLFVYCHSGARSARAVSALQAIGFTDVQNIGGISNWHGEIER